MGIYIVDAFTDRAFAGNPAAVCVLKKTMEEEWMQNVAREMNLSETAFVYKLADQYNLRWFTPRVEVDLCGHATLASAHVLWEAGIHPADSEVIFQTKSGTLTAKKNEIGIELDFPAEPSHECDEPELLREALGINRIIYVGRNRMDYLVEVEDEDIIRGLSPDFQRLAQIQSRGVIVTSKSNHSEHDFVSRCFFPAAGVNEDPVTGSAHCCLGPYWRERLKKDVFTAFQMSERGGVVGVIVKGDRVILSGSAITVLRGELSV